MEKLNEVALTYKSKSTRNTNISHSQDAFKACLQALEQAEAELELKEYFMVMLLNNANEVLGYYKVSEGGITGTLVDVRLVFATALKCVATGIILFHNHPSGKLVPSENDKAITRKFKEGGNILDVKVLDHLIITPNAYFSFADEGVL